MKKCLSILLVLVMLITAIPFSSYATQVAGDVNGDGDTNSSDVAVLLQYLAGWDVNIVYGDINNDGNINASDVGVLMQYVAGWDVEIGLPQTTLAPTEEPTPEPTEEPTAEPTDEPTEAPVVTPAPTDDPSLMTGINYYHIDFSEEAFDTIEELEALGWTFPKSEDGTSTFATISEGKLQVGIGKTTGGGTASYYFAPLAISGEAGTASPYGKDAKVEVIMTGVSMSGAGTQYRYVKTMGTNADGTNRDVANINRTGSNAYTAFGKAVVDAEGTGNTSGNLTVRFIIKVSDQDGMWLENPLMTVYNVLEDGTEILLCEDELIKYKNDKGDTVTSDVMNISILALSSAGGNNRRAFLGSCDINVLTLSDDIVLPTPAPVEKSALDSALTSAYELYDTVSANVGDEEGKYSQAVVTALNVAITSAQAVYDNENVSQNAVDQAVVNLNNVIATVVPNTATPEPTAEPTEEPTAEPTVEPTTEPTPEPTEEPTPEPTAEPTGVDKTELISAIDDANAIYQVASNNVGDEAGQYSQAIVSALGSTIVQAQNIYDNEEATADEVAEIILALRDIIADCVTNEPTPTAEVIVPTEEPVITEEPETIITNLLVDDFEDYESIDEMVANGWSVHVVTSPEPTVSPYFYIPTDTEDNQVLRIPGGTNASRTFDAVNLREEAGQSPGRNATLIVSFDGYTGGGSGSSSAFWKVENSSLDHIKVEDGQTPTADCLVGAGRRAGKGGIYYARSISSSFSGLKLAGGTTRYSKFKFVIKITDEYGEYLPDGPEISVYFDDMTTPIAGGEKVGPITSTITKVDRFIVTSGYNNTEVDNLEIYLTTTGAAATPVPIPTTPPDNDIAVYGVRTVSTFNSMSIYANYLSDSETAPVCKVKYRETGTSAWTQGQDLWTDVENKEFRGSLVYLDEGTEYDIELEYSNDVGTYTYPISATTWDETFPENEVTVIENQNTTLTISESGTSRGYNVYTGPEGKQGVLDMGRESNNAIVINASYVIIRNLDITGSTKNAIVIDPSCHDVIIENCNITNWGPDGPARDGNTVYYNLDTASAIISGYDSMPKTGSQRIIIQNNKIGPAAGCASSWDLGHPAGPQGITLYQSLGNNVIRYNEIVGDETHYFNDAIGGGMNQGSGNLKCDTDVYGNIARYCYDDAFELEGWNMNVRVWNNYADKSWRAMATAQVKNDLRGPMYIFRNIFGPQGETGGYATKIQGNVGPVYFYHNMFGLPDAYISAGIHPTVKTGSVKYITTRNNIFFINSSHEGGPISKNWRYYQDGTINFLDYDHFVYNVTKDNSFDQQHEQNAIYTAPTLEVVGDSIANKNYYHTVESSGYDKALLLPGFNQDFDGLAPDTGVSERGKYEFKAGIQESLK